MRDYFGISSISCGKTLVKAMSVTLLATVLLGACADKSKRVYFDGKYYPAKAKKVKGDRESFTVSVRKAAQGLDGAREAGRHAGVRYCVETFGWSGIDWVQGPDADEGTLVVSNGNLILKGRCQVWK